MAKRNIKRKKNYSMIGWVKHPSNATAREYFKLPHATFTFKKVKDLKETPYKGYNYEAWAELRRSRHGYTIKGYPVKEGK